MRKVILWFFKSERCENCGEKYVYAYKSCKTCLRYHLKKYSAKYRSGNKKINDLIQEIKLEINNASDVIFEWVLYDQFDEIVEIWKGGFATVY